jgi:1-acyl-sn-glycerol-3-phosphate acyltransferase
MASRSPLGALGLRVYNALYWPYLIGTCVLFFVPAVAIWLLTLWDPKKRALHLFTSFWGAHYLAWAPYASVRVENRERALAAAPCIYVSNHQSMVDILAAFATYLPYRWVSKRANFFAPFLGWTMWLNGYVPLRRGHLPSIRRMLRRCEAELKTGNSLFVFPEGTRSPDGELRSFYRGAFWLAARNGVPVVPIVIQGTREILPKRSILIRPQEVVVRVLPAIDARPYGGDDRRLRDDVRLAMAAGLSALRSEMAATAPATLAASPAHANRRAHPAKAGDARSA